jgi:sulfur carrier protein ThiS
MRVRVVSPFPIRGLESDGTLELQEGARVRDLLKRSLSAALYTKFVPVSVNGRQVAPSSRLQEGDLVVILMPIGGG